MVGLAIFDLRRRGNVGEFSMVGTHGSKFPAICTSVIFSNKTCIITLVASGDKSSKLKKEE